MSAPGGRGALRASTELRPPAQAACAGPSLLYHVLYVSFGSQKSSLIYFDGKHTFHANRCISSKELTFHVNLTGCLSPGQVLALPGPARVGPHAALPASLVKMRFSGRVSTLGMHSAMHGPYLPGLLLVVQRNSHFLKKFELLHQSIDVIRILAHT